jgi:hypothetical protein
MYAHSSGHIQLNLINSIAISLAQQRAFRPHPETRPYFEISLSAAFHRLSRPFRHGDLHYFLRLSLPWPFRCKSSFAFTIDSAGLSKRRSWSFEAVLCSDAASLLHPAAATFTTLWDYREDSPGHELKANSTKQSQVTWQKKRVLENQLT